MSTHQITQPILRRLRDINEGDTGGRRRNRSELELGASAVEACKTCPKPVWFTAYFDGTGNNYEQDGNKATDEASTKYSNCLLYTSPSPRDS